MYQHRLALPILFASLGLFHFMGGLDPASAEELRAGASLVDITPLEFPVIRNGSFLEGQITLATEKLHARCLALDDGDTRLAMVVVDSCMIPRTLCDAAKALAERTTGLAKDRILISATHTHSAPSVMNFCLGSRADPGYTAFLLPKLVRAIELAVTNLRPAEAAWASVDAGDYTHCRRWITRADAMQEDPFGERTVRAMMHPGYQSPRFVGPSGPADPWLSFLSVRTIDGSPLALLGNFSMHYFSGHAGASADYFGVFCRELAGRLAAADDNENFVGILSQGTSGDLWWADYARPKIERDIKSYASELVDLVMEAYGRANHESDISLAMAEKRFVLGRRTPDEKRLAWAREMLQGMAGRRPKNRPEVYAEQAIYLHENPTEEVVLQAIRVGELGIAAMPNEVYALTGLKVRYQSPLATTFTVSLANGAAGYIPPPEQHALGGYNTWPARTAGLEVEAEPKIVEGVLTLLEEVSGRPRRLYVEPKGAYATAVLASEPHFYWRLGELGGRHLLDATPHARHGKVVGDVAFYLSGIDDAASSAGKYASRCLHLAGGHLSGEMGQTGDQSTVTLWFWNGIPNDLQATTGVLVEAGGLTLGIAGKGEHAGRLFVSGEGLDLLHGESVIEQGRWHHVALVRDASRIRAYLDGSPEVEIDETLELSEEKGRVITVGRGFQGKVDEVAVYDRSLSVEALGTLLQQRK